MISCNLKNPFSLRNLSFLFAACVLTYSQCVIRDANEVCIQCDPTELLQNKVCYPRIRGCLIQTGETCQTCQNAFTRVNSLCVRTVDLQNSKPEENVIPPVVIENPGKLTKQQIQKQAQQMVQNGSENSSNQGQQQSFPPGSYRPVTNFQDVLYLRAKGFLFNSHPQLKQENLNLVKADIQVVAGTNFRFTYRTKDESKTYQIIIFRGLNGQISQRQFNVTQKEITQKPILGGFNAIQNIQDPRVQKVLEFIFKNNSQLKKQQLTIKKAERQIVAGTNYKFTLTKINDPSLQFEVTVFQALDGSLVQNSLIQSINLPDKKPVLGGYSPIKDFQDPKFIQAETFFFRQHPEILKSNVILISAEIQTVAGFNFRLIYESRDKARRFQATIFMRIDGSLEENYFIETSLKTQEGQISSNVLGQISNLDSQKFKTFFIQQFKKTKTNGSTYLYQVNILTKNGKYKLTITQNQSTNSVILDNVQQISKNSCFIIQNSTIIRNNSKINRLQQYIKTQNIVPTSNQNQLTAVQISFKGETTLNNYISYKLLYSSPLMQKRVITIDQKSPNQFQVIKNQILSDGSQLLRPSDQSFISLSTFLLQKYPENFTGSSSAIAQVKMAEIKGNMIIIIYEIGMQVYEARAITNLNNQISNVAFTKVDESVSAIPSNYRAEQIINVQQALEIQKVQLTNKFLRSQYSHYLGNGPIVLVAAKQFESFQLIRILYQTSIGYFQGSVKYFAANKEVKLSNFVLTGIRNFSIQSCLQRNVDGKCISCRQNQVISLNSCFKQIKDCLTQIGSKCYSCQKYSFSEGGSTCESRCSI